MSNQLEVLAAYAHGSWSGWMRYMFENSGHEADGTVTIPAGLVERWERQMNTPYEELLEREKASDRAEAANIQQVIRKAQGEGVIAWKNSDNLETFAEQLDGLKCELNGFKERLNRGPGAREIALVVTKVEEAEQWLRSAREVMGVIDLNG